MDTNAGCQANTNMIMDDEDDVNKNGEDEFFLEIHQHRSWTRLAETVRKGRGPRRIEVRLI